METQSKRRKVMQFGNNQLIITLPKDFIDNSGIKKGDTVGLVYDSILAIVIPKLPEKEKK